MRWWGKAGYPHRSGPAEIIQQIQKCTFSVRIFINQLIFEKKIFLLRLKVVFTIYLPRSKKEANDSVELEGGGWGSDGGGGGLVNPIERVGGEA